MTAPAGQTVVSPLMIGRTKQLDLLSSLLDQACAGSGQTVTVSGEAGIGKSRLVAEAQKLAQQRAMRICQGNCFETDRSLPYAPLLDLLRTSLGNLTNGQIAPELEEAAPEIIKISPELRVRLPYIEPTPLLEPEQEKRRLFETVTRFLFNIAERIPLLVVLEDLHWCDDTSLEWLLYLARRSNTQPLLILLTYRSDEVNPALAHFLAEMDRQRLGTEIGLDPLTARDVSRMMQAIFRLSRPVRPEFLQAVYTLTEGNPFFIEEVLKSLVVEGDIYYTGSTWDRKPVDDLRIPRTVHDAVRRRSANLSQPTNQVMKIASVMGQRFTFTLLQELTGQDESGLLDGMKELINAQLVVEASAEQFAFRHALTRQAVYSDLLVRERRTLHRQIAATMERVYAGLIEPHIPDLAYHYFEAEEWEKALEYAQKAGEKAQALDSPGAAVEHFTRAIEAAEHMSAKPPRWLHRERGLANETLGDFERARADHETTLSIAGQAGEMQAEWQSFMDLGVLWSGRDYVQAGHYFEEALRLARRMEDPRFVAHSLNRVGNWRLNLEQPVLALENHREALTILQQLDDRKGLAETFDLLGMASGLNGDTTASVGYYAQAIELFRELGDKKGLASSLAVLPAWSSNFHIEMTIPAVDKVEAMTASEEALGLSRGIGWRAGEAFALIVVGSVLATLGRYTEALDAGHRGLQIAESIEHKQWMAFGSFSLGSIYLDIFEIDRARAYLKQALSLAEEVGSLQWTFVATGVMTSLNVQEGEYSDAEEALCRVLHADTPMETAGQRLAWCASGELALARGEAEKALDTVQRLMKSVPGSDEQGPRVVPRLACLQGKILAATSRQGEAEEWFLTAIEAAQAQKMMSRLWRAHAMLADLYRSENRLPEANRQDQQSRALVTEMAANMPEDLREQFTVRAIDLIEGISKSAGQARRPGRRTPGGLTGREGQVAALLAQGRSNRQIADSLVLTERTVEGHVSNILSKLGFTSRSQIAVWAAENNLASGEQ